MHRRPQTLISGQDCTRRLRTLNAFERTLIVLLVAFVAGLAPSGALATNVSGTISANTTWTLANSPYVMTGNVTVSAGVTLTVEPGVIVQGNATGRSLTINGSLSAVGTSSQPITFTSSSDSGPGQWLGITFGSGSGTSTLKYVNARDGGGSGVATANGMVTVSGGTVTVEDSTFSASSVSGLTVSSANGSGSGVSLTVRRSKFEANGFVGAALHGDGLYAVNAPIVVEDSAFWSNATDGMAVTVGSTYTAAPAQISGTSIWNNGRYGLWGSLTSGTAALGPDGNIAGKPPNELYDNGTFGLSASDTWLQLSVSVASLSMDWSGAYWGPVTVIPCDLGTHNPHLSYNAPDSNPGASVPVPRGPVSRTVAVGGGGSWCGNDMVLDTPVEDEQPDLYFDPPPPVFGGIGLGQTFGCVQCQIAARTLALSLDEPGRNPLHYTPWPVNTASGSLTEFATDLRLAGPGVPFAWTRSYNSRDATSGALGPGWTEPFEAKITVVDQNTGELDYHAGSGQDTHFARTSGGAGAATFAAKGFDGTLQRLANGSYKMVTRDQRTFLFNSSGKLTQITPRFLPATTLSYTNEKLSSITDSAGRTITISYLASDSPLIERVTLPDGRYVQYGYTSGRLTSVQDARSKTWTLTYNGSGYLTSICDPLSHCEIQNVQYNGQGQVTSEQNGSGDAITYSYTTDSPYDLTTVSVPGRGDWVYRHIHYLLMSVTDPLNRVTTYRYDPMARKTRVKDGRGYISRFEYNAYGNPTRDVAPAAVGGFSVVRTFNSTNDLLTETDGRGNTTSYVYATGSDPAANYQVGQLKTITDRENGVTTFKYWTTTSTPAPPADNVGLLKSVTNPRSKTTSYGYDADGNRKTITTPLGYKTTLGYDSSGRLTSSRDPRGNTVPPTGYLTQWSYDNVDHVSSLTDANGNVTNFDYNDSELLWKTTRYENDGTPRVTTLQYDDANRLWKTTMPRGGEETRLYWPDAQLKSVDSPEHRKTTYDYDDAGQLHTLVEPNGNAAGATASDWTWTYGYDDSGNRNSASHPDGGTSSIHHDALNRPDQWTDALQHTRSVVYDENNNVTTSTDGLTHSKHFTYDKLDRLKTAEDERSKTWTYDYFATGELLRVTSPLLNKRSYDIDDDGRTTSMVEPRGNESPRIPADYTWTYGYDPVGNRQRVTDPLGNYSEYHYDALNNLTQVSDERHNDTTFTYDSMNRLWKVVPPAAGASGTLETSYGYDADGNLHSRSNPYGHGTLWEHDLDGLQNQRTTPVGSWNSSYDANGNLKTLETPAGSSTGTAGDGTITYGYDRMSRLASTDYSDSTPDVTRTWDDAGRPDTMSDGSGSVTYSFDNADRLTDITRSGGGSGLNGTLHYDYDDARNISGRTYPDSTSVGATFDDDGRLQTVTSAGATTTFGYDAAGNLTTTTLPSGNGYVETRTFDRAGRLTGVDNARSGTSLSTFAWTLDPTGNPTKARSTRAGGDVYDAYEYDARNRLTASCFDVAASATDCAGATNEIAYSYDKVSNRTQEVRSGNVGNTGTIDYAYNSADQLTGATKDGQTTGYTYDANGNQASAGSRSFTYDLANELASTTLSGTTTSYSYDGDGRRLSATTGGGADLRFTWDPLAATGIPELALERDPSGNLVRRYFAGPLGAVSMTNASGSFYYQHDPLANVTDVTDASGVAQWRYAYEAYGVLRSATDVTGSAPANPLHFEGQYLDGETGLYHLRARQYDPGIGRFEALDPVENELDSPYVGSYVYVGGQPTVLVDPLGLFSLSGAFNAAVGTASAVGNAFAGAANVATGGVSNWALGGFGIHPDTSSPFYKLGEFAGAAAVVGGAVGAAAKLCRAAFAVDEVGSGLAYSVGFEMRLAETSYPGFSRAAHYQEANANLLAAMEADQTFAAAMEALIPGIRNQLMGARSVARAPPSGWTWHHALEPGVMQLVPRAQHGAAGPLQILLHPRGLGGYSIWG